MVSAAATIEMHLRSCLPEDAPLSFRRIVSARFIGSGRNRIAYGDLEMFDGLPATVEVFQAGPELWGHRWSDMPGGHCSLENGTWVRCDECGNLANATRLALETKKGA